MENENDGPNLMIPVAIIVAGLIIAGAVVYSSSNSQGTLGRAAAGDSREKKELSDTPKAVDNLKEVTNSDHIRGDLNAPVKIVEFSDLECPFCKRFHETMRQVIEEYDGKVAWIYRHFPLDTLHSKARKEAEASECAAELGGNGAFWAYLDRLFEITPSNNGLDPSQLPEIAEYTGIEKGAFKDCLDSGRYAEHVADNLKDAIASGGTGTPYSILIGPDGKKLVIYGAQPYPVVKQALDSLLEN